MAARLTERDASLWLSRSWTTRPRRPGEDESAYVFVDRETFEKRAAEGGFLEWAEFLGQLYGTPEPDPPPGHDLLLEIDLAGAEQVLARRPDAVVVLLVPPSPEVQRRRMAARGDQPEEIERRLAKGRQEVHRGRELAAAVVVNDQLERAVDQVAGIVASARSS